jgi:hypothetical protein
MKSGYVTLQLDGDRLIVSCSGYIYCLNPLTGEFFGTIRCADMEYRGLHH